MAYETPAEKLARMEQRVAEMEAEKARDRAPVRKGVPDAAPAVRVGEDPLSSRPVYFAKAAKALLTRDFGDAKLEVDFSEKFKKAMQDYYGRGADGYSGNAILLPLSWNLVPPEIAGDASYAPWKKAISAAVENLDPDQIEGRRMVATFTKGERQVFKKTAMSYTDQTTGGALVRPPEFGDLIPILRNKAVLQNIGATQVPLPVQGSVKYPRQTAVTTVYARPENTAGTESNPTFDDVTLEPKQYIGLVRASNQLLQYAPGLAEATIRNDMAEQMALTFDRDGLEGDGGPNRVKGIINQAGITTVAALNTGTDGDTLVPKDVTRIIAEAMKKNSDVKTWIMRPDMWLGITEFRGDAAVPGDASGPYLFHLLRTFADDFGETLRQRKVVTSNQVSQSRAKGSATDLTYLLGVDGQEILIGMHGAMALDANPYESTAWAANQTVLRAIMFGDVQVRRGAGVVFMDDLIVPNLDAA